MVTSGDLAIKKILREFARYYPAGTAVEAATAPKITIKHESKKQWT
jgi:hypothetical protein